MRNEYKEKLQDKIEDALMRMSCEELLLLVVAQLRIHDHIEFADADLRDALLYCIVPSCNRLGCMDILASEIGVDYSMDDYEYEIEQEEQDMREARESDELDYQLAIGV